MWVFSRFFSFKWKWKWKSMSRHCCPLNVFFLSIKVTLPNLRIAKKIISPQLENWVTTQPANKSKKFFLNLIISINMKIVYCLFKRESLNRHEVTKYYNNEIVKMENQEMEIVNYTTFCCFFTVEEILTGISLWWMRFLVLHRFRFAFVSCFREALWNTYILEKKNWKFGNESLKTKSSQSINLSINFFIYRQKAFLKFSLRQVQRKIVISNLILFYRRFPIKFRLNLVPFQPISLTILTKNHPKLSIKKIDSISVKVP